MTFSQIALIVVTCMALSVGQVLFKIASSTLVLTKSGLILSLINLKLFIAMFVYVIATGMWLLVLKQTPLRIAYPFAALSFMFVPLLAHYFLDEPLSWNTLAGAVLIGLGVWVSAYK